MKKYNIDKGDSLGLKALGWFIGNSYKEIYLREFSRVLNISPNSAQRFLNLFLEHAWITETKRGHLRYFKANLENLTFKHLKITLSLKSIEDSGIVTYLKGVGVSSLILFGSVAKGVDSSESDVDLLCISTNKNINYKQFERNIGMELHMNIFSWAEWKKQKLYNKAFYQDIIKDGIALIGDKPIVD